MPAQKIIHVQEVLRQFDKGWTATEVAEWYMGKYNVEATPSAFLMIYKRMRGEAPGLRNDASDLIPWDLLPDDRDSYVAGLLRAESRRRRGIALTAKQEKQLDSWLARRAANDEVVHYEPASKLRWVYLPRRPGIDDDLIYTPGHD